MLQLQRIVPGVYMLSFKEHIDLCYAFMRYQEFYESPSEKFREKKFSWAEYMRWYTLNPASGRTGGNKTAFYYPSDWSGFNIPLDVIKQVIELGIPDANHYDALMLSVYKMIMSECDKAYLIGAEPGTTTQDHEMTHAMYYLNDKYRNEVLNIIEGSYYKHSFSANRKNAINEIKKVLYGIGYTDKTMTDEINAFITTGEQGRFKHINKSALASLRKDLKKLHKQYFPKFISGK